MAIRTDIEWTESTWNPITGCTKISRGCRYCYAERMAHRLSAMGHPNYINGFQVTLHEHVLEMPLKWNRPQMIFVNSMSDMFHKNVPLEFIQKIFEVMHKAAHHQFQVLTKRSNRLLELNSKLTWLRNVWIGVTVENIDYINRIEHLKKTGAQVKFLSLEPLLGPIPNMDLNGIDWVIVGGESGQKARPLNIDWIRDIRDQCLHAKVPFFFKQWGGSNKKKNGRILDGRTWDQKPVNNIILAS